MKMIHFYVIFKGDSTRNLCKDLSCSRAFKIEHPECVPFVENFYCFRIIYWIPVSIIYFDTMVSFHKINAVPYYGKASVSEDVYFYKTCIFYRIFFPLEHLCPVGRYLNRAIAPYFIRDYNNPTAVNGQVIEMVLQLHGCGQYVIPWISEFNIPHLWMILEFTPHLF